MTVKGLLGLLSANWIEQNEWCCRPWPQRVNLELHTGKPKPCIIHYRILIINIFGTLSLIWDQKKNSNNHTVAQSPRATLCYKRNKTISTKPVCFFGCSAAPTAKRGSSTVVGLLNKTKGGTENTIWSSLANLHEWMRTSKIIPL